MTPDVQSQPPHSQLTPARARLCALIPRLSEREVEALLAVAEAFAKRPDVQSATGASAPPHAPAEPGTPAVPARPPSASPSPPIEDAPYTLSVPQAAQLLGVSERRLRKQIREGRVTLLRLHRRVLLSRTAIVRLVASGEVRSRR